MPSRARASVSRHPRVNVQAAKDMRDDPDAPKKRQRARKSDVADKGERAEDDDDGYGDDRAGGPRKKQRPKSAVWDDGTWHPHLPLKRYARPQGSQA
jgi:hypothetical protein